MHRTCRIGKKNRWWGSIRWWYSNNADKDTEELSFIFLICSKRYSLFYCLFNLMLSHEYCCFLLSSHFGFGHVLFGSLRRFSICRRSFLNVVPVDHRFFSIVYTFWCRTFNFLLFTINCRFSFIVVYYVALVLLTTLFMSLNFLCLKWRQIPSFSI